MEGEALDGRVLIIDDEPANVRLLERLLERAGYAAVLSTTDSREAVRLFSQFQPDIVLLDLLMPHLDGFAVMRELIHLIPQSSYLPILVLTADATPDIKRRALAAGARDFLTKPFDVTEVLLRIANLLETRRLYRERETQNERLEEQVRERTERLLQTEKIATLGSLLAGVAHELNNPLTIVLGRTLLLRNSLPPELAGHHLEQLGKAADRCARIIKNFLALARRWPPERTHVALNTLVRETVEMLGYELRTSDVEVEIDAADDVPPLWADPHQLQQVLVNLVVNAHHAMRDSPPPRRLSISTRFDRERGVIRLVVADTGPGIPPDVRARIFEPFFTTKPLGQGTGLGLSLCQGIVENHGGVMRLEGDPGPGAVFSIELPLVTPEVAGAETSRGHAAPVVGGKTILVVDDESDVARMLAEMLTAEGHQVDTADNGLRGLEKVQKRAYDLILSDSGMPGLDGPAFYRAVERFDPRLVNRFIFLPGDTLNAKTNEALDAIRARRINKPFTLEQVRDAVRRLLADPAS